MVKAIIILSIFVLSAIAVSDEDQFRSFQTTYRKSYRTQSEFAKRFKIFKDNMIRAEELSVLNKGSATFGATRYADLTPEEFVKKYLSPMTPVPSVGSIPMKTDFTGPSNLRSCHPDLQNFDWASCGATTEIKDQGLCACGWAMASVEAVESSYALQNGTLVALSVEQVVDCNSNSSGCHGGNVTSALNYIQATGGLLTDAAYPFTATGGISFACRFANVSASTTASLTTQASSLSTGGRTTSSSSGSSFTGTSTSSSSSKTGSSSTSTTGSSSWTGGSTSSSSSQTGGSSTSTTSGSSSWTGGSTSSSTSGSSQTGSSSTTTARPTTTTSGSSWTGGSTTTTSSSGSSWTTHQSTSTTSSSSSWTGGSTTTTSSGSSWTSHQTSTTSGGSSGHSTGSTSGHSSGSSSGGSGSSSGKSSGGSSSSGGSGSSASGSSSGGSASTTGSYESDYDDVSYGFMKRNLEQKPQVSVANFSLLNGETGIYSQLSSAAGGPVVVAVDASTWALYTGGVVTTCGTEINHYAQVVGYIGYGDTGAYWIVRNSFGSQWGEAGSIWLAVGSNVCGIASAPMVVTAKVL